MVCPPFLDTGSALPFAKRSKSTQKRLPGSPEKWVVAYDFWSKILDFESLNLASGWGGDRGSPGPCIHDSVQYPYRTPLSMGGGASSPSILVDTKIGMLRARVAGLWSK